MGNRHQAGSKLETLWLCGSHLGPLVLQENSLSLITSVFASISLLYTQALPLHFEYVYVISHFSDHSMLSQKIWIQFGALSALVLIECDQKVNTGFSQHQCWEGYLRLCTLLPLVTLNLSRSRDECWSCTFLQTLDMLQLHISLSYIFSHQVTFTHKTTF